MLKTFKSYSAAKKFAGDLPIFNFDSKLFIVSDEPLPSYTSFQIIGPPGKWSSRDITATITMKHLERLGNANHATPAPQWAGKGTVWNNKEGN